MCTIVQLKYNIIVRIIGINVYITLLIVSMGEEPENFDAALAPVFF